MRRIFSAVVLLVTATLLAACTSDEVSVRPGVELPFDASGATIYQARCASCHGEDLRGTEKGPSQLSIVYEPNHHGDDAYRSAIRNGAPQHHWAFGDMPAVEDITDAQIDLVISYVRAEQKRLGFER